MVWDQKAHTVVMVNDEEKEKPVRLAIIGREEIVAKRSTIRKISARFPNQSFTLLYRISLVPSTVEPRYKEVPRYRKKCSL